MTGVPLGPGPEFDLIRRFAAGATLPPGVSVGIGDDAACLDGGWVVSTDLTVEEVHFRREWGAPDAWGARAVRAALSDLAAMAASPVAVLLSLAGSADDRASGVLGRVGQGARDAAEACGAPLIGGDVARSPGPITIDVVALGRTADPLLRSGARPGDELWVTGRLGGAAAAVRMLGEGREVPEALWERYARPRPRLAEAAWLAATGTLRAGLDLSDGLSGDARHLAAASGVALEIEEGRLPLDPHAVAAMGEPAARQLALSGGEDFELLFAATPELFGHAVDFRRRFPEVSLTRVGRISAGDGVRLCAADGRTSPAPRAFDHFSSAGSGEP